MAIKNHIRILSGALLSVAVVLFLIVNIASSHLLKGIRYDLTAQKLYTLSAGTKKIIAGIDEPITVRMFFSKKLAKLNPYIITYGTRVQDLLLQYARSSNGKIVVDFIDPEPMSSAEEDAQIYGLQAIPVDELGNELYFGIVASNSVGVTKVIPFLQPAREAALEYDISQILATLQNPNRPVIGIISALPIDGRGVRPWMVWQQLSAQFEIQLLEQDIQEIPQNITALMLVRPHSFANTALQAVDQFVMRGGHVIAYLDPYSESADPDLGPIIPPENSEFDRMMATWGVVMEPGKVVADRSIAKQVRIEENGRPKVLRYPVWLDITEKNLAQDDLITSTIDRITMASAGSIKVLENAALHFEPLITTSDNAMLLNATEVSDYQQNLAEELQNYKASGSYVVAARISGPLKSAYGEQQTPASNIILVADADMLHDHFWISFQNVLGQEYAMPTAGNGNFVVSALDNLCGSDALISIRNRGTFVRPFTKMQDIEAAAANDSRDEKFKADKMIKSIEMWVKFFSIGLIPLIIVLGGMLVWGYQISSEVRGKARH